jgi:hypothetical protein
MCCYYYTLIFCLRQHLRLPLATKQKSRSELTCSFSISLIVTEYYGNGGLPVVVGVEKIEAAFFDRQLCLGTQPLT